VCTNDDNDDDDDNNNNNDNNNLCLFTFWLNSVEGHILKCHRHEHLTTCQLQTVTDRNVAIHLLREKERWLLVDGI
jgi:hypothetical protein